MSKQKKIIQLYFRIPTRGADYVSLFWYKILTTDLKYLLNKFPKIVINNSEHLKNHINFNEN